MISNCIAEEQSAEISRAFVLFDKTNDNKIPEKNIGTVMKILGIDVSKA